MNVPITHGDADRGFKLCKCADCGYEAECSPLNDFYTRGDDAAGPLYCERCITKQVTT